MIESARRYLLMNCGKKSYNRWKVNGTPMVLKSFVFALVTMAALMFSACQGRDYSALENGQRLRLSIPNSKLIVMPNSGHFPFVETPGAFLLTVGSFLKANSL